MKRVRLPPSGCALQADRDQRLQPCADAPAVAAVRAGPKQPESIARGSAQDAPTRAQPARHPARLPQAVRWRQRCVCRPLDRMSRHQPGAADRCRTSTRQPPHHAAMRRSPRPGSQSCRPSRHRAPQHRCTPRRHGMRSAGHGFAPRRRPTDDRRMQAPARDARWRGATAPTRDRSASR